MGATARYTWPYPEASDAPDVPGDLASLASSVEESVGAIDDRLTTLTGLSQSIFQYTSVFRSSSTPMQIPHAVWTPIIFEFAQTNLPAANPGFVQNSPTRITCMQTGLYRLSGFAGLAANATGNRAIAFRVNGNPSYPAVQSGWPQDAGIGWYGSIGVECRINTNDFVELCLRHTSGANLAMDTVYPRFSMQRVV